MLAGFAAAGCLLVSLPSPAQQTQRIFGTRNGTIQITAIWHDSVLVARSEKLGVVLNYQTAEIVMTLDPSTLRTGIDSLDKKLAKSNRPPYRYVGKLGIDYIKTEKHPPLDFEVTGDLVCAPHHATIDGQGRLVHIFDELYACMLNMTFEFSRKKVHLDIGLPDAEDSLYVEIVQSVLRRDYE